MIRENDYQKNLKNKLKIMFPGCYIFKVNANLIQGMPDLIILYNDKWAALECKRNSKASYRPNQKHYIDILNQMSFAAVIYPGNEEVVLHDLQQAFRHSRRNACISRGV